jgi:hypothetical protein
MLREVGVAQSLLTSAHYKQGPPSKLINSVSSPIYASFRTPVCGRPGQKRMRRTTQAAASTESMQSAPSTRYLYDRLKGNEVCAGQSGSSWYPHPAIAWFRARRCPAYLNVPCEMDKFPGHLCITSFLTCLSHMQVYLVSEQRKLDLTSLWSESDIAVVFWARSMGCFFCQ